MGTRKSLYKNNQNDSGGKFGGEKAPVVLYVAVALHNYDAQDEDELDMRQGDEIQCIDNHNEEPDWPEGFNRRTNTIGRFPKNYIQIKNQANTAVSKKIRASVISKSPETIKVNLSGDATSIKQYVAQVIADYRHEQNDEHDLVVGDKVLVTATSREDEDWAYGKINGQGDTKIFPLEYIKKVSITPTQLSMVKFGQSAASIGTSKKSVRASLMQKPVNKPLIQQNPQIPSKLAPNTFYEVLEDYIPENDDELNLKIGDVIKATEYTEDEGWLIGIKDGDQKSGVFCDEYCKKIPPPKPKAVLASEPSDDVYGVVNDNIESILHENTPPISSVDKALSSNTKVLGYWEAVENYESDRHNEFSLRVGEIYEAIEELMPDWYKGRIKGSSGILKEFCTVYMKKIDPNKPKVSVRKSVQTSNQHSYQQPRMPEKPKDISSSHLKPSQAMPSPVKSSSFQGNEDSNRVISQLTEKVKQMESNNAALESALDEMRSNYHKMESTLNQLSSKLNKVSDESSKTSTSVSRTEGDVQSVKDLIQKIEGDVSTMTDNLQNDVERKLKSFDQRVRSIETTQSQLQSSATVNQGLSGEDKEDIQAMKKRLEKLKATILHQNASIAEINEKVGDQNNISRRLTSIEGRIKRMDI